MSNQEIRKSEEQELDYLKNYANDYGLSDLSAHDITLPRLKICQMPSPIKSEITISDGEFYDTLFKKNYGNKLSFIPLFFWKSRVWFSDELKLIQSVRQWKGDVVLTTDVPLEALSIENSYESYNYYIILEEDLIRSLKTNDISLPMIWSTIKSANSPTRKMNSKISANASRGYPIFAQIIVMETEYKSFKKGSAYMPKYSFGRFITKEEAILLTKMHESVLKMQEAGIPEKTAENIIEE